MTPQDFCNWLEGLMNGSDEQRAKLARPTITTPAQEAVNHELRPSIVACFPAGTFIITIAKAGP